MGVVDPKNVCQIALVVKDIEESVKKYAELFGMEAPKIFTLPEAGVYDTIYRGKKVDTSAKLAVFHLGHINFELTQPGDAPSTWKEFYDEKGEGVHHIGIKVDDRKSVMNFFENQGIKTRQYGEHPGGNYTMTDSEEKYGVVFNIKAIDDSKK